LCICSFSPRRANSTCLSALWARGTELMINEDFKKANKTRQTKPKVSFNDTKQIFVELGCLYSPDHDSWMEKAWGGQYHVTKGFVIFQGCLPTAGPSHIRHEPEQVDQVRLHSCIKPTSTRSDRRALPSARLLPAASNAERILCAVSYEPR
jgi:hypothetical protein